MSHGRILVVDDEQDFGEIMVEYLRSNGYEAEAATDGPSAIERFDAFHPHLVLLDIHMPLMDGLEVLERINQRDRKVGVIMVTALNDESIGRRALKLGAADFITKPVDLEYLDKSVMTKIVSILADLPADDL